MKLLFQKTIASDLQLQKKLQIDEGLALARRVDKLREALLSLEAQHRKFIEGTRQSLKDAVGNLETRKTSLEGEVRSLEEKLKIKVPISAPLSTKEKIKFANKLTDLTVVEVELENKSKALKDTEKAILKLKTNAQDKLNDANDNLARAKEAKEKAERVLAQNQNEQNKQKEEFKVKDKEFTKRKEELDGRANAIELFDRKIKEREKMINEKERAVNDKYETLIRTITRFKKK